jgi:ornithine decarboxylase
LAKQTLTAAQRRLRDLAKKHGTPLMVISRSALKRQVRRFREALPRVEPFFAVKANPHPEIVKTMVGESTGFDVASLPEIRAVLAAGAKPDRLIYANTVKPVASLIAALKAGVNLMTFDSEYELDKIAEHAPRARVLARVKVPNIGSIVELSLKFGADPSDAMSLLIKSKKMGLDPVGLSFHVGSQCTRVENYIQALEIASILLKDAQLKQLPLSIVDIGGGYPIPHFDHEDDPFDSSAPVIRREIDRLIPGNIRMIAEPGRFMVGPAVTLVMGVIGKSIRENKHWYYLDDGLYADLSGMVFDHCKYQFKVMRNGRTQLSTLAGPTCDSFDIIERGEELPELELGDLVYVENIGAYSSASATSFNGLEPAKIIVVN